MILSHRLGDLALVVLLREQLERCAPDFPTILGAVLYSGAHAGDYLTPDQVEAVRRELRSLRTIHADGQLEEEFLRHFEQQMRDLVACSLKMRKPICF